MKVKDRWKEQLARCEDRARAFLVEHPCDHKYHITCRAYDEELKELLDPVPVTIELDDDEYVRIMARMKSVIYKFTFNALLYWEPKIAQKINSQALSVMEENQCQDLCPYIIQLDEFDADCPAIPSDPEDDLPF